MEIPTAPGKPWYKAVPLGHNTLARKLKDMFELARLCSENKSNHSLRATAISRMFVEKVPEKIIMEPYQKRAFAHMKEPQLHKRKLFLIFCQILQQQAVHE